MMHLGSWKSSDEEKRLLRIKVSQLEPALEKQRQKRRESEKEVRELERELEERRKRIEELEKENDELRRQRDQYRDMLFKKSKKREESKEVEERIIADAHKAERKRKRGGQRGHVGKGRKVPVRVDAVVRVHLEQCPDCGNPLKRGKKVTKHTVQDIAPLEKAQTQVIRYETERQWCNHCKKRVKGVYAGVIPGSRLGINVFLYVLMLRYVCRNTWETIIKCLDIFFGLKVSVGTVVDMMHRGRKWFKPRYEELLEAIRKSPVKHADETTWRVEGENHCLPHCFCGSNPIA